MSNQKCPAANAYVLKDSGGGGRFEIVGLGEESLRCITESLASAQAHLVKRKSLVIERIRRLSASSENFSPASTKDVLFDKRLFQVLDGNFDFDSDCENISEISSRSNDISYKTADEGKAHSPTEHSDHEGYFSSDEKFYLDEKEVLATRGEIFARDFRGGTSRGEPSDDEGYGLVVSYPLNYSSSESFASAESDLSGSGLDEEEEYVEEHRPYPGLEESSSVEQEPASLLVKANDSLLLRHVNVSRKSKEAKYGSRESSGISFASVYKDKMELYRCATQGDVLLRKEEPAKHIHQVIVNNRSEEPVRVSAASSPSTLDECSSVDESKTDEQSATILVKREAVGEANKSVEVVGPLNNAKYFSIGSSKKGKGSIDTEIQCIMNESHKPTAVKSVSAMASERVPAKAEERVSATNEKNLNSKREVSAKVCEKDRQGSTEGIEGIRADHHDDKCVPPLSGSTSLPSLEEKFNPLLKRFASFDTFRYICYDADLSTFMACAKMYYLDSTSLARMLSSRNDVHRVLTHQKYTTNGTFVVNPSFSFKDKALPVFSPPQSSITLTTINVQQHENGATSSPLKWQHQKGDANNLQLRHQNAPFHVRESEPQEGTPTKAKLSSSSDTLVGSSRSSLVLATTPPISETKEGDDAVMPDLLLQDSPCDSFPSSHLGGLPSTSDDSVFHNQVVVSPLAYYDNLQVSSSSLSPALVDMASTVVGTAVVSAIRYIATGSGFQSPDLIICSDVEELPIESPNFDEVPKLLPFMSARQVSIEASIEGESASNDQVMEVVRVNNDFGLVNDSDYTMYMCGVHGIFGVPPDSPDPNLVTLKQNTDQSKKFVLQAPPEARRKRSCSDKKCVSEPTLPSSPEVRTELYPDVQAEPAVQSLSYSDRKCVSEPTLPSSLEVRTELYPDVQAEPAMQSVSCSDSLEPTTLSSPEVRKELLCPDVQAEPAVQTPDKKCISEPTLPSSPEVRKELLCPDMQAEQSLIQTSNSEPILSASSKGKNEDANAEKLNCAITSPIFLQAPPHVEEQLSRPNMPTPTSTCSMDHLTVPVTSPTFPLFGRDLIVECTSPLPVKKWTLGSTPPIIVTPPSPLHSKDKSFSLLDKCPECITATSSATSLVVFLCQIEEESTTMNSALQQQHTVPIPEGIVHEIFAIPPAESVDQSGSKLSIYNAAEKYNEMIMHQLILDDDSDFENAVTSPDNFERDIPRQSYSQEVSTVLATTQTNQVIPIIIITTPPTGQQPDYPYSFSNPFKLGAHEKAISNTPLNVADNRDDNGSVADSLSALSKISRGIEDVNFPSKFEATATRSVDEKPKVEVAAESPGHEVLESCESTVSSPSDMFDPESVAEGARLTMESYILDSLMMRTDSAGEVSDSSVPESPATSKCQSSESFANLKYASNSAEEVRVSSAKQKKHAARNAMERSDYRSLVNKLNALSRLKYQYASSVESDDEQLNKRQEEPINKLALLESLAAGHCTRTTSAPLLTVVEVKGSLVNLKVPIKNAIERTSTLTEHLRLQTDVLRNCISVPELKVQIFPEKCDKGTCAPSLKSESSVKVVDKQPKLAARSRSCGRTGSLPSTVKSVPKILIQQSPSSCRIKLSMESPAKGRRRFSLPSTRSASLKQKDASWSEHKGAVKSRNVKKSSSEPSLISSLHSLEHECSSSSSSAEIDSSSSTKRQCTSAPSLHSSVADHGVPPHTSKTIEEKSLEQKIKAILLALENDSRDRRQRYAMPAVDSPLECRPPPPTPVTSQRSFTSRLTPSLSPLRNRQFPYTDINPTYQKYLKMLATATPLMQRILVNSDWPVVAFLLEVPTRQYSPQPPEWFRSLQRDHAQISRLCSPSARPPSAKIQGRDLAPSGSPLLKERVYTMLSSHRSLQHEHDINRKDDTRPILGGDEESDPSDNEDMYTEPSSYRSLQHEDDISLPDEHSSGPVEGDGEAKEVRASSAKKERMTLSSMSKVIQKHNLNKLQSRKKQQSMGPTTENAMQYQPAPSNKIKKTEEPTSSTAVERREQKCDLSYSKDKLRKDTDGKQRYKNIMKRESAKLAREEETEQSESSETNDTLELDTSPSEFMHKISNKRSSSNKERHETRIMHEKRSSSSKGKRQAGLYSKPGYSATVSEEEESVSDERSEVFQEISEKNKSKLMGKVRQKMGSASGKKVQLKEKSPSASRSSTKEKHRELTSEGRHSISTKERQREQTRSTSEGRHSISTKERQREQTRSALHSSHKERQKEQTKSASESRHSSHKERQKEQTRSASEYRHSTNKERPREKTRSWSVSENGHSSGKKKEHARSASERRHSSSKERRREQVSDKHSSSRKKEHPRSASEKRHSSRERRRSMSEERFTERERIRSSSKNRQSKNKDRERNTSERKSSSHKDRERSTSERQHTSFSFERENSNSKKALSGKNVTAGKGKSASRPKTHSGVEGQQVYPEEPEHVRLVLGRPPSGKGKREQVKQDFSDRQVHVKSTYAEKSESHKEKEKAKSASGRSAHSGKERRQAKSAPVSPSVSLDKELYEDVRNNDRHLSTSSRHRESSSRSHEDLRNDRWLSTSSRNGESSSRSHEDLRNDRRFSTSSRNGESSRSALSKGKQVIKQNVCVSDIEGKNGSVKQLSLMMVKGSKTADVQKYKPDSSCNILDDSSEELKKSAIKKHKGGESTRHGQHSTHHEAKHNTGDRTHNAPKSPKANGEAEKATQDNAARPISETSSVRVTSPVAKRPGQRREGQHSASTGRKQVSQKSSSEDITMISSLLSSTRDPSEDNLNKAYQCSTKGLVCSPGSARSRIPSVTESLSVEDTEGEAVVMISTEITDITDISDTDETELPHHGRETYHTFPASKESESCFSDQNVFSTEVTSTSADGIDSEVAIAAASVTDTDNLYDESVPSLTAQECDMADFYNKIAPNHGELTASASDSADLYGESLSTLPIHQMYNKSATTDSASESAPSLPPQQSDASNSDELPRQESDAADPTHYDDSSTREELAHSEDYGSDRSFSASVHTRSSCEESTDAVSKSYSNQKTSMIQNCNLLKSPAPSTLSSFQSPNTAISTDAFSEGTTSFCEGQQKSASASLTSEVASLSSATSESANILKKDKKKRAGLKKFFKKMF